MFKLAQLSVKSKLILMVLLVSLGSILVIGYLGWRSMRQAMEESAFNHLSSVRSSKAYQIESYFQNLSHQVDILSKDESLIEAMVRMGRTFRQLNQELVRAEWDEMTNGYYETEFLSRLSPGISGEPVIERYLPASPSARYLQYYYISANRHPVGEKHLLDDAGDGSDYSEAHARYHPFFRETVAKFGYKDMFLINFDSEEVVYSVHKNVDYGTNLAAGPYTQSSLATLVRQVKANPQRGAVQVVDYAPYTPAYEAPAAFMGAPIYNGPHPIGIMAIQLPVNEINRVISGQQQWQADGLGLTGETYLVGPDLRMRSTSRFLSEDPAAYLATLRAAGVAQNELQRIELFQTSVLLQEVNTLPARAAVGGQAGTEVTEGYRGVPLVSSYQPLAIEGLDWAILSEMALSEINQPLRAQEQTLLIATSILVLVVVIIAIIMSYLFVRPLNTLIMGTQQVGTGKDMVRLTSGDEFSKLAETFGNVVTQFRQQVERINQKNRRRDLQLAGLLPGIVLERIDQGQTHLVEQVQGVTVIFIRVFGFTDLMLHQPNRESTALFQEFNRPLDDLARQFDLERIEAIGESFMMTCGLTKPHLDHVKRTLDFALALNESIQQFNRRHNTTLSLSAGVDSGPVTFSIVNAETFTYDLWGESLNIAHELLAAAPRDTVLVSASVYERHRDMYTFESFALLDVEKNFRLETWQLKSRHRYMSAPPATPDLATDNSPATETEQQVSSS